MRFRIFHIAILVSLIAVGCDPAAISEAELSEKPDSVLTDPLQAASDTVDMTTGLGVELLSLKH